MTADLNGLDALRALMLEALPLDGPRDLEAQIEISFWGRVVGSSKLRGLQNSEFERLWARLRRHLDEADELGHLDPALDLDLATHQLVALIDGVSAERVLYPSRVPPDRQVVMLDGLLDGVRARTRRRAAKAPTPPVVPATVRRSAGGRERTTGGRGRTGEGRPR